MNCPYCGYDLGEKNPRSCPRCGQPLAASPYGYPDNAGMPADAPSGPPPPFSDWSLPPGYGSFSEQPPTGPTFPASQPFQPGASGPAAPYQIPPVTPAPVKPTRRSSRKRRNITAGIVAAVIIVLCAGWGYLTFFVSSQTTTINQAPLPASNVLFSDPLTSNSNGWSDTTSHCFFQGNAYHIKNNYVCYAPAGDIGDATITVQAKQVAGSLLYAYGIAFRLTASTRDWYEFDIDSNSKWVFYKHLNGTSSQLVPYTPNAAIKGGLNSVNTLSVTAKGSHFVFSVNGTQVGEADDTSFSSGLSGLVAGGPIEAAYTNFEITKVS